jgi:RNA polymerase sigma-70 factor (ECF subfamily)
MTDSPNTSPTLLVRIRDARDDAAWAQFVQLYSPLVYRYARRSGLQDADAADLTQDVLWAVSASIRRLEYDSQRGTFRGWLFTVVHHKLYDLRRRQQAQVQGSGHSGAQALLDEQPARAEIDWWEEGYQQHLLTAAAERVRPEVADTTWQAFWQTAVEGRSGQEVANALGLSVAAVYLAKSRVMARLKEQISQWETL